MTTIILTIAGAVIGLITFVKIAFYTWPLSLLLIALGIYGWLFSRKQYERNRFHTEIMSEFRDEFDNELRSAGKPSTQSTPRISDLRTAGEKKHYDNFPRSKKGVQKSAKSKLARSSLAGFWASLHLVISMIGLLLLAFTLSRQFFPELVSR